MVQQLHLEDSDASTLTRFSLDKFYLVCMVASILSVYILIISCEREGPLNYDVFSSRKVSEMPDG